MPAKIIETNSTPLQTVEVDGVTIDIIENALKNAREEMDAVLFRTAMSPGISLSASFISLLPKSARVISATL